MGCYVIAVGGTGNKILESVVYAACADAFYTVDSTGMRRPLPRLDLLSVDVDAACGNTTRAKRAAEYYEEVRQAFAHSPHERRCFHTELAVDKWSMDLSKRAASVDQLSRNHSRDQLLARTLFTSTEARLEYSEGFRGHPDLGVLFFAEMLGSLDQARKSGLPDEFNDLIDRMDQDILNGETVKVILCGSIFGGTGASGIPAIAKYLHARYAQKREQFVLGSMLMLPYYRVPEATVDEKAEIVVRSDEFLDKARTALQYYGMEGMIRDSDSDPNGIFDAVYLLGLPPEQFVSTRIYSTGSQSQENDAHVLEWLATRCIARFLRTGFRGADAKNIDCYYYQWHTHGLSWDSFDDDAALYQARYGGMLKAAAVYVSECYPTLRKYVARRSRRCGQVNYVSACFHRVRRVSTVHRTQLTNRLDSLYRFWAFYVNWFQQVISTLPPALRAEEEQLVDVPLLSALSSLLGEAKPSRENRRLLQRGLTHLICQSVTDRRDMAHVLSALGGAECRPSTTDAAFAAFLTALMQAVWHHD